MVYSSVLLMSLEGGTMGTKVVWRGENLLIRFFSATFGKNASYFVLT